jgi:hypothetical protein
MATPQFQEIRELCSKITKEPNTARLVPLIAKLRKLLAELKVSTKKVTS